MPVLLEIFLTFAKIGLFTFGGGYAMISIIDNNCVERKKWITHDEMMNITVIAESTPGPIAINCATYVGYKKGGFLGACAATIGVVLPSFVIIYIISIFLDNFLQIAWIAKAFTGIKAAVGLLILDAAINMIKKMNKKVLPIGILVGACLVMLTVNFFSLKFSSIVLMLIAAAVSVVVFLIRKNLAKKGGNV
ncbi:MAG: chromate transporter [Lachnospiraceae bacterium]|nr:chromate transporter [Lachnospiraceae bacterium]